MKWDYSVEIAEKIADNAGGYYPYGIKITKTLFDDSNVEIIKTDTTIEDAYENAGPSFVSEFFATAKNIFTEQVSDMFNYSDDPNYHVTGPSKTAALTIAMHDALVKGMYLINGEQN